MKENKDKPPDYETLFGNIVKMQVEVAKTFIKNQKIKNELEKKT